MVRVGPVVAFEWLSAPDPSITGVYCVRALSVSYMSSAVARHRPIRPMKWTKGVLIWLRSISMNKII